MSSLTTAGSAEEHNSVTVEELGTHLSLGIGVGGGGGSSRPPRTVTLFGEVLSLHDDDDHGRHHRRGPAAAAPPAAASRKKRDRSGNVTAAGRQNKKAREITGGDDGRRPTSTSGGGGGGGGDGRQKLRLTGAQATMLEDSFRAHNILSHAEKQELARRVGLSARQVEVWFQNRRARTKLKQTELDCDLLRRWCDRLTDENARLRRDLADLRASATLAVCVSCGDQQVAGVAPRAPARRHDATPAPA